MSRRPADQSGYATHTIAGIAAKLRLRVRSSRVAAVVVALAILSSGVGPARAAASSTTAPPTQWDARVAPIAHEVERIRGLTFEHPVKVEYLDDAAFRKRLSHGDDEDDERDSAGEKRAEAQLHAIGLIAKEVDLGDAVDDFEAAGVLAYYDTDTKMITVRGRDLDAMVKSTLAHELTHALDDQHFDLDAMDRAASKTHTTAVVDALVEGDAVRVEDEYVAALPKAEREAHAAGERESGASVDDELESADIPVAVSIFFLSPYSLGLQMVRLAAADGGNASVDRLFRDPPTSEVAFLDVATAANGADPMIVPPPTIEPGERRSGPRDSFGAFALYLMLSTAMDPVEALDVVHGWGGDAMVTVTRGEETCVRAAFTGRDPRASDVIAAALNRWSTNAAHPSSVVTTKGPITTLLTCDGDAPATDPAIELERASASVLLRNGILLEGARQGAPSSLVECAADDMAHTPEFASYRDAQAASPQSATPEDVLTAFRRTFTTVLADCGRRG